MQRHCRQLRCHRWLLGITRAQTAGVAGRFCWAAVEVGSCPAHLPARGSRHAAGGCGISGRQAMATLKAPNSLSSYGGLGKQKDFSAAREVFGLRRRPGRGQALVG